MKILAIMGSPRKGESYKATKLLEERMKTLGEIEFEYLFLRDLKLGNCIGCQLCCDKGEEKCPLKDDRDIAVEKMMNADGIIMVSPVYSQHVTALMKNFIDHLSFMWHRPRLIGKKVMALSTGGGMFKETLGYLETNANFWGCHFVHKLGIPHLESLKPKFREKIMSDLDTAASVFYNAVKEDRKPVPSLGALFRFNMWKSNAIACKEVLPRDYPYWLEKGWIDKEYFYDTKIGLHKKLALKVIGIIGGIYMSRMYVGY
jgi:multimeric flavodoxin WrbA